MGFVTFIRFTSQWLGVLKVRMFKLQCVRGTGRPAKSAPKSSIILANVTKPLDLCVVVEQHNAAAAGRETIQLGEKKAHVRPEELNG
jgi:hypothetical protein